MRSIDEYFKILIIDPFNNAMSEWNKVDGAVNSLIDNRPKELSQFKAHLAKVRNMHNVVKGMSYVVDINIIVKAIQQEIEAATEQWMQQMDDEYAKVDEAILQRKSQIEEENKLWNKSIKNENVQANAGYETLETKRKTLESYSDKIFDVCSQYGIMTSDVDIDEKMFTFDELNKLYDGYLDFIDKDVNKGNAIRTFRRICPNVITQGVVLLIILALCFTQVLDALAIIFFALLAFNQARQASRVKYYTILMGITFKIKPEEMGFVQFDDTQIRPEEITDEMMDSDERFAEFVEMYDAIEASYADSNPENQQAILMNDFEKNRSLFDSKAKQNKAASDNKQKEIVLKIEKEIEFLEKEYERLKYEFKTVGERFSSHLYFAENYTLGLHDDCIEENVKIGMRNIIFRPTKDAELMKKFMQVMLANALCNVFPGKLVIYIYDPNTMGRVFMPFYTQEMSKFIIIESNDLSKVLNPLVDQTQMNFKDMGGQNIQEYNKEAEEVGKTPKDYNLLIIMSQPKTVEEDEKLNSFLQYSASGGTFVWIVSEALTLPDTYVFPNPYAGVQNPLINIDDNWCKKVRINFLTAIDKMKTASLAWQDFMENAIVGKTDKDRTKDNMKGVWTKTAASFVEYYPGYLNGDPTSYKPYTIGNEGNVHVIGVGGTGAGKSVFLNHLVTSSCTLYPPEEYELWLCDFKGVEFKAYLNNDAHPFMLPHIAACLCTSDPDFATSLFKAFRDMADTRYEDMKFIGVKNMPGWNTFVKSNIGKDKPADLVVYHRENLKEFEYTDKWSEKDIWPRTVLICDEFQVIFQKADPKNLERINADITQIAKVARAAGAHIFFTSQSMKGTVSDDILQQFTLRFALRCDKEVSMAILGTPNSSNIREKNGYLYVRSVEMGLEDQKRYRTPFLNDGPPKWKQENWEKIPASYTNDKGDEVKVSDDERKKTADANKASNTKNRAARDKIYNMIRYTQTTDKIESVNNDPYSELHIVIRALYERAKARNYKFRDVITYEESTKHPIQELKDLYANPVVKAKLPKSGVFFIGNRMAYSKNKAPDNIIMPAQNNENIMSVFNNIKDLVLFFKSLITNINCNEVPGTVIINSQVKDLAYVTEAEDCITNEAHKRLLSEKVSCAEMVDWMITLKERRESTGKKDTPIWIFLLGWDKGSGIGVEYDGLLGSKLGVFLQTCGESNIHVIFINNGLGSIKPSLIEACKHRMVGKCSQDESTVMIGTRQGSALYEGMPTGWVFRWQGGAITRDKLYISPINREIASTEVIL